jgi:hypothetical protein
MIPDDEPLVFAKPREPRHETPGLVEELEQLGFRPFTTEW